MSDDPTPQTPGGGLRVLGAAVTLPWIFLYGISGAWAAAKAVNAMSAGMKTMDAGYTRFVRPVELLYVSGVLGAGFAVMLACAILILFGTRSAVAWLLLLVAAGLLTAGAVWAGVVGELHPILWSLLFSGLVYVAAISVLRLVQVTRAGRRARILRP